MFGRTSFAIVAALGALLVAAPASADNWGADRYDDGGVTAMLDARERAFKVKQVERFAAAHSPREPVVDDRFGIDPTSSPSPVAVVPSARELEWPQIGVGLALGVLLGLGLVLAVRIVDVRPPAAR